MTESGSTGPDHWFEPLAEHLGSAYLRYSFTRGTTNEVSFLIDELGLEPGSRVLDVGCGPGRHARALAEQGIEVVGVDISERFIEIARLDAPAGATFERLDARQLPFEAEFDAVISLCQGAFGLVGTDPITGAIDPDGVVLAGMARAVRPGGRVAVSAFSAYFQVRYLEDADTFDADRGSTTSGRSCARSRASTPRPTCGPPCSHPASCGCWRRRPASRSTPSGA